MNRRKEERILEAVFEDANLSDTLSPAETARMNEYREIRHSLQLLKEVPEDQMSKERLRDAILNRGLGQTPARRERSRYAVLMAPAASFAIAFVAIVILKNGGPTPQGNFVESLEPISMATVEPIKVTPRADVRAKVPPAAKVSSVVAQAPKTSRSRFNRPAASRLIEEAPDEILVASNPNGMVTGNPAADVKAGLSVEKLEPVTLGAGGESASGPIVLIEPAASAEEPARATETSTGANTLVGG